MNLIPRSFFLDDFLDDLEPVKINNMKCDIYEKNNAYVIEMDVPGFDKNDIEINLDNGYLTISASHEENNDDNTKNYIRRERNSYKCSRKFYLGDVSYENIKAEFNNGILKIVVPKKEEIVSKKKIEIE